LAVEGGADGWEGGGVALRSRCVVSGVLLE
jgi:hypothetical protein